MTPAPEATRSPEHIVTIARMVTQSLLEEAQQVEQAHAANLADPRPGPGRRPHHRTGTASRVHRELAGRAAARHRGGPPPRPHRRAVAGPDRGRDRVRREPALCRGVLGTAGRGTRRGARRQCRRAGTDSAGEPGWEHQGDAHTGQAGSPGTIEQDEIW